MSPRFALGLPHAPWAPGRKESFERLCESLHVGNHYGITGIRAASAERCFQDRAPNHIWSGKMWWWALDTDATHFVTVQDDIEVAPCFWEILRAMVEAKPEAVWGLHSPRGLTPTKHSVYASSDGLIGTAYCLPVRFLAGFMNWRAKIPEETLAGMASDGFGEDSLLGLWCYAQTIPILHPRPSFIRHQTQIASTYGNDRNPGRQPAYPLNFDDVASVEAMTKPEYWAVDPGRPERYYDTTHISMMRYAPGSPHESFLRGFDEVREQRAMRRLTAQGGEERKPRIKIATPRSDGWVTDLCARTIIDLTRWPEADWMPAAFYDYDVDVARAYVVRDFLKTDGTHLLWIDRKIGAKPELIGGMLRASLMGGHDYVAAPYARTMHEPGVIRWSVRQLDPAGDLPPPDEWGCSEVAGAGLGCTLVTRAMLEKMTLEYGFGAKLGGGREDIRFQNPRQDEAVDLFGRDRGLLGDDSKPSEDFAFGARWRALGGRVMLYRGRGAPAQHASMTVWGGHGT